MNRKPLAIALLLPFTAFTVFALMQVGYVGLFTYQMQNAGGWQVLIDLVIALILVISWMIPDARATGRNPWPWVVATLFLGSIAPLAYLAFSRPAAQ